MNKKTLEKYISKYDAIINDLKNKRNKLIDQFGTYTIDDMKKNIGKCYKYWNHYDYGGWWLYVLITDVIDSRYYKVFQFETDSNNQTKINICKKYRIDEDVNYHPISRESFDSQWNIIKIEIDYIFTGCF